MMIPERMDQPMNHDSQKTARIRQKVKEVFGWDCTMTDDTLLKRYSVTADGDLIMKLK
jgi:hypothetical protein